MADDEAIRLLEAALFLHQNGERPPGAPHDDLEAETRRRWERDTETYLRSLLPPETVDLDVRAGQIAREPLPRRFP